MISTSLEREVDGMQKDCHTTALSYLEHRDRSVQEVRLHLSSKGFDREEIEEEIKTLQDLHYVDDERYCDHYIEYALRKGRGPVRILYELKEKGIPSELIQKVLDTYFDKEMEREAAMREAQKLLKPDLDEKLIAKIGRKLAAQGYHTDIIYDVIGRLRRN